jgi:Acetyltransferase (GNAT) domain
MQAMRVTSPAPRELWEATLASDPNALVSQTPAWTDCICSYGGYVDASRLYELDSGRVLVLPMVRRRNLPAPLAWEASMPRNWETGGIVAAGGVRAGDVAAVISDLSGRAVIRTSLRPSPRDAPHWAAARGAAAAVPHLAHVLELEGGFGRVWERRFTGGARKAVRRASRSGLTVERDTSGRLVPVIYELFERSIDRWASARREPRVLARLRGRRRDPRRKFEHIARTMGEACRIWVAWHEGQPAAAIVVLQGTNASYTRGMMDKELAGPTRANYLLHQLAIEEACNAGCRFYDMGDSGASASLSQFKTRFGATPHPYGNYHVERLAFTFLERQALSTVKRAIRAPG